MFFGYIQFWFIQIYILYGHRDDLVRAGFVHQEFKAQYRMIVVGDEQVMEGPEHVRLSNLNKHQYDAKE